MAFLPHGEPPDLSAASCPLGLLHLRNVVLAAALPLASGTFSLSLNSIQAIESPGTAVCQSVHLVPATGITTASSLASLWSPAPVRFPRHWSDRGTSLLPDLSLPIEEKKIQTS